MLTFDAVRRRDGGMMIQRKLFANFRHHRVFNLSEADIAHRDLIVRFLSSPS